MFFLMSYLNFYIACFLIFIYVLSLIRWIKITSTSSDYWCHNCLVILNKKLKSIGLWWYWWTWYKWLWYTVIIHYLKHDKKNLFSYFVLIKLFSWIMLKWLLKIDWYIEIYLLLQDTFQKKRKKSGYKDAKIKKWK